MIIIWYKLKDGNKMVIFIQVSKLNKIQRFMIKVIIKYYKIILIAIMKIEINL